MKQFDCSVFDEPIWGIIFGVFEVRRTILAGYFFASSMFGIRFDNSGNYFSCCSISTKDFLVDLSNFNNFRLTGGLDFENHDFLCF